MATGFDRARLKVPLRFFRYFLSRPSFDIDRNPDVASQFGVRSIPAVFGVKRGAVADAFISVRDQLMK